MYNAFWLLQDLHPNACPTPAERTAGGLDCVPVFRLRNDHFVFYHGSFQKHAEQSAVLFLWSCIGVQNIICIRRQGAILPPCMLFLVAIAEDRLRFSSLIRSPRGYSGKVRFLLRIFEKSVCSPESRYISGKGQCAGLQPFQFQEPPRGLSEAFVFFRPRISARYLPSTARVRSRP